MHSPLEKKFNEYTGKIHSLLREDASYLNEPSFINQLLDKIEYVKRNFILMNAETEDVYIYQEHLARLSNITKDTQQWVENINVPAVATSPTINELKENLFMMNDLFSTSQNLMKSFYPVI